MPGRAVACYLLSQTPRDRMLVKERVQPRRPAHACSFAYGDVIGTVHCASRNSSTRPSSSRSIYSTFKNTFFNKNFNNLLRYLPNYVLNT